MFAFGLSFVWVHSVKNGAGGGRWGRDWSHVIRGFNAINRLLFVQICITKGERTIGTEEYFLEKVKLFFTSAPKLWLNSYPLNSREERYSTVLCYCFPRNIWGSSTPLSYPRGCPAALSFQLKKALPNQRSTRMSSLLSSLHIVSILPRQARLDLHLLCPRHINKQKINEIQGASWIR